MQTFRFIVGAAVFLALLYLSLQNSAVVELTIFNVASLKAPLIVVVFVAFASGVAVGLLAGALRASRLKRQVSKLRREQRDGVPAATGVNGTGPVYSRGDRSPEPGAFPKVRRRSASSRDRGAVGACRSGARATPPARQADRPVPRGSARACSRS